MSQNLLKSFPAQGPSKALVTLWDAYSQIFSKSVLQPEQSNQEPLQVDCNLMLIDLPQDKQGGHAHNNPHHNKDKNHPNWTRPKQQYSNQSPGFKKTDIKVFQESGLSDDPERKAWYYQDDDKQNQGPFSSKEMDTLLSKNIVDYQTRVALDSLEKFVRIEKIVKVYQQSQAKSQSKDSPQIHPTPRVKNQHPIQEPFRQSELSKEDQASVWYYKVQNEIKGPLTCQVIDDLWKNSQINEETQIAYLSIDKFVKFDKILKMAEETIAKKTKESDATNIVQAETKKSDESKKKVVEDKPQKEQQNQPKAVSTTSPVKVTNQSQKTEKVNVQPTEVPQPEKKKVQPKSEITPVQPQQKQAQPILIQNANSFQEQEQEDDEWTSVGPSSQSRKKPKNAISNAQQVPGLQATYSKGQTTQQPPKKSITPLAPPKNIQGQDQQLEAEEEDEWQEVDTRKGKKK